VLPLQFPEGESAESLGLEGEETFDIEGLEEALGQPTSEQRHLHVRAVREGSGRVEFDARLRLDTPNEVQYYEHGGILHRVLRRAAVAT
jgi:aconitate hydratase